MAMRMSSIMEIITKGNVMRRMRRKPTHPGSILKEDYLGSIPITVTDMAARLEVSRKTLSKILNGKGAVTPDMALRLSRALGTTPELWMNLQRNFDLWEAENRSNDWRRVRPLTKNMLQSNP